VPLELSEDARLLVEIVERTGIKPHTLARLIGIEGSTLTRHMPDERTGLPKSHTPRSMHAETRRKLENFSANWDTTHKGFSEDPAPFNYADRDPVSEAVRTLIAGRDGFLAFTLMNRAVELEGYLPGDTLIVDFNNCTAKPGDVVFAEIRDSSRTRPETVVRVFDRAPPVDLLIARSFDPTLRRTLVIDGVRVVLKGTVLPHRLRR
jgi:hypothetical protein